MEKIKKVIKLLFCFLVVFEMALPVNALAFSYPSPVEAMDQIFNNLGVDKNELTKNIESLNSARYKKPEPQVMLSFDPANPVPDKKVTVVATPSYFNNDYTQLYYTWFLKISGCSDIYDKNYQYKKGCDLNDDGKVNIEDHKIRASRIIVNNGFDWENESYSIDNDRDGYRAILGGNDQGGKNTYCYIRSRKTGLDYKLQGTGENGEDTENCGSVRDHLFPYAPGKRTGDNSFDNKEEEFWHTDPHDPDTANIGNGDEAAIAGLGITTFSWVYTHGDKVGVVVEGVSNEPTTEKDSSYKIMWATPKNIFSPDDNDLETGTKEDATTTTTDNAPVVDQSTTVTTTTTTVTELNDDLTQATITTTKTTVTTVKEMYNDQNILSSTTTTTGPTTETRDIEDEIKISRVRDINSLLYKALIDPYEGGGASEKLDVSLDYSPSYPMNDPSSGGISGDDLKVVASVTNVENNDFLNYTWQVYSSNDSNPKSWGEPLLKSSLVNSTQTSGIGLDSFKFNLNFPGSPKYLKVKVVVKENVSRGLTREGRSEVVVPLQSVSENIKAFNTNFSGDGLTLYLGDSEICSEGIDRQICPVVKDEIIGLDLPGNEMTDFYWTVDGEPLSYNGCFFEGCEENKQTNVAFFPILEDTGHQYSIGLTATNISTGEKVNLTRYFQVVDPEVKISCADTSATSSCQSVLLGRYVDVNGKNWPDYSENNLQTIQYQPLKLKASFVGFTPSSENYEWAVDGISVTESNAESLGYKIDEAKNLLLPGKALGDNYTVGIVGLYAPDSFTQKALNRYWGVSYGELYEKAITHTAYIETVPFLSSSKETSQTPTDKKIVASLYSSLPAYLAFVFRIALSGMLLIFVSRFIMSFFPVFREKEI